MNKNKAVSPTTARKRKPKKPEPFGPKGYPSFNFYISHDMLQVVPARDNVALYGDKFARFQRWLDQVKKWADYEMRDDY